MLMVLWSFSGLTGLDCEGWSGLVWGSILCFFLLVMARGTNGYSSTRVKDLRRFSQASLFLMHFLLAVVVVYALYHRIDPRTDDIVYKPFKSFESTCQGLAQIAYSFTGIQY